MIPNPMNLVKEQGNNKEELPKVEQLGTISLETLHQYHCNNPDRRLVSLFGTVYDVTSSLNSYGPDGAYKEYAGHDATLALAKHKTDEEWLDRFVKMDEAWIKDAKGWAEYFEAKYPICAKLDKWDENMDDWPALTPEELEALNKGCIIM